jgi:hypothetical protein
MIGGRLGGAPLNGRGGFGRTFLWAVSLAAIYSASSFLWSAIGFLHPVPPAHLHEYALPALATEVGGHVLFGVAAALPSLDYGLVLLAGGESVLIDSDHLLAALGYPVEGRLAHSVFFALAAACVIGYASSKGGGPGRGAFFVTLSSVAAHLSFDVFAGNGLFDVLSPVSFAAFDFPYWTWPLLMAAALSMAAAAGAGRLRALPARFNPPGPAEGDGWPTTQ